MSQVEPAVTASSAPLVRLVPVPRYEPPFDDGAARPFVPVEGRAANALAQGTLALTFLLPTDVPAVPEGRPLRVVAGASQRAADAGDNGQRGDRRTYAPLPDPTVWATRLAQALVEVVAGVRPVEQLRRWTSDEVYVQIRRQRGTLRVREPDRGTRPAVRVRVRAVRVCLPAEGVAEASAVVEEGARTRALALRMEAVDGRWRLLAYGRV
jgi:hypothetical protein